MKLIYLRSRNTKGDISYPLPSWKNGWDERFRSYLTDKCEQLNHSEDTQYFVADTATGEIFQ